MDKKQNISLMHKLANRSRIMLKTLFSLNFHPPNTFLGPVTWGRKTHIQLFRLEAMSWLGRSRVPSRPNLWIERDTSFSHLGAGIWGGTYGNVAMVLGGDNVDDQFDEVLLEPVARGLNQVRHGGHYFLCQYFFTVFISPSKMRLYLIV